MSPPGLRLGCGWFMTERPDKLDSVELLLGELRDAKHAGLFERTSVSLGAANAASAHNQPGLPAWVLHLRRRWVPIAAALGLAVTAWSFLFSRELNRLRQERIVGSAAPLAPDATPGDQFAFGCLSGPGGTIDDGCRSFDLDTDGKVTLADFRRHQLAMAVHTR